MVVPESIGQYVGIKDKKGNLIFEGDIVTYEGITSGGEKIVREISYYESGAQFMADGYTINNVSYVYGPIVIGNAFEKSF